MKTRMIVAALVLATSSLPALAGSSGCTHEKQAQMSCAEGTQWDSTTRTCVEMSS